MLDLNLYGDQTDNAQGQVFAQLRAALTASEIKVPETPHDYDNDPSFTVPADQDLPEIFDGSRRAIPCILCRRKRMNNGGQAVRVSSRARDYVSFYCRVCRKSFELPRAVFTFPTRPECDVSQEGCASFNTLAYKTRGATQFRKCTDCGNTFTVIGKQKK